jgi:hypothetical protein
MFILHVAVPECCNSGHRKSPNIPALFLSGYSVIYINKSPLMENIISKPT